MKGFRPSRFSPEGANDLQLVAREVNVRIYSRRVAAGQALFDQPPAANRRLSMAKLLAAIAEVDLEESGVAQEKSSNASADSGIE